MPNSYTAHSKRKRQQAARAAELANVRAGGWNVRLNIPPPQAQKLRAAMKRTNRKAIHIVVELLDTLDPP